MTSAPLDAINSATLDGTGAATVRLGPTGAREVWNAAYVHVQTNQAPGDIVNEAQCFIYLGETSPERFVDSTSSGSTGDSTDAASALPVPIGTNVYAVWSGGDAGAQANLRVSGTKEV